MNDGTGDGSLSHEEPSPVPQEKLIAVVRERMLAQTERLREKYPAVALGGRSSSASFRTWAAANAPNAARSGIAAIPERAGNVSMNCTNWLFFDRSCRIPSFLRSPGGKIRILQTDAGVRKSTHTL